MKQVSFWPIWDHIQKIREKKWFKDAIKLANEYLTKDPENVEAYLQLMDIYYLEWELDKAEKPVDFLLQQNLWNSHIKRDVLYYIKALLLAERTQWEDAKKYIKKAIKSEPENIEYKRVLAMVEFWIWNKTKWYKLIKEIIENNNMIDAEMLLNAVTMSLSLWENEDAKKYINIYLNSDKKITFFTKPKKFYDRQFNNFKTALLLNENIKWKN